jgi:Ca2+-binding EF-hand superfamily protein
MKRNITIGVLISIMFILAVPTLMLGAQYSKPGIGIPDSVFTQMDTNQNGKALTPEQLKARRQKLFEAMDTNKDNILSKNEMIVYEKTIFTKYDINKDGVITPKEIKKEGKVYFDRLDTNKDGKVTPEELNAKLTEVVMIMDKNADGNITLEEYYIYWIDRDAKTASEKAKTTN